MTSRPISWTSDDRAGLLECSATSTCLSSRFSSQKFEIFLSNDRKNTTGRSQLDKHVWTFLAVCGSFMAILAEFGHLADFGGQYTYLAEFVTFVLNMLETCFGGVYTQVSGHGKSIGTIFKHLRLA